MKKYVLLWYLSGLRGTLELYALPNIQSNPKYIKGGIKIEALKKEKKGDRDSGELRIEECRDSFKLELMPKNIP